MPSVGEPTLDQLTVFVTVVDQGSFSAAARRLGRAQSVISYAVATLEAQLGVGLFDRERTRVPALTEAGRALLADARRVVSSVKEVRARAAGLQAGLEAEVSIAVDVMVPMDVVATALAEHRRVHPSVPVRLYVEALGAVAERVMTGSAAIGVTGPLWMDLRGSERAELGRVELVAVSAPSHPLAGVRPPIPSARVRDHIQLVLTDRSRLTEGRDFGVAGGQDWRLADLGAKHALLIAGVGWGNMPEPIVRADLAMGRLVRLRLQEWSSGVYPMYSIWRSDAAPGPAGKHLVECIGAGLKLDEHDGG